MLLLWSVEMVIVLAMIGVQLSFDFFVRLGVQIGVQLENRECKQPICVDVGAIAPLLLVGEDGILGC